jgi:uncharacterized membrane protein YhaH (DUF805 family)
MSFGEAIQSGFQNYVNFNGRSSRSAFWYWVLFAIIVGIVTAGIDYALGISLINPLAQLALLLPGIAISVRRLHDIDRSGWWLLLAFIPLIGAIILIVWYCLAGTPGNNRFGAEATA